MYLFSPALCLPVCCLPTFPTLSFCENKAGAQSKSWETSSRRRKKERQLISFIRCLLSYIDRQIHKNAPSADTLVILSEIFTLCAKFNWRRKSPREYAHTELVLCSCAFTTSCVVHICQFVGKTFFSLTVDVSVDIKRIVFFSKLAEIKLWRNTPVWLWFYRITRVFWNILPYVSKSLPHTFEVWRINFLWPVKKQYLQDTSCIVDAFKEPLPFFFGLIFARYSSCHWV